MIRYLSITLFLAIRAAASIQAAEPLAKPLDYLRDVRPILARNCFACHGADDKARAKELRLDVRDFAVKELKSGATPIVPGDPEASEIVSRITEEDETRRMPPKKTGSPLTKKDVDTLRAWIGQGANYAEHWAFVKPARRPPPAVSDADWPRNAIDRWILAGLDREGLKPSPEADKYTLLRRASLDLRGLPASPAEIERFATDPSPDAYLKAVDRFLDDSAYGERWARVWLDLARYADSSGFGSDPLRTIWRYRDWVIDAYNRNLPYDQFTVEQLAGDMLPNPSVEQRMATAFHRNTMTNTEGGTDDEEFRSAAVKDRVDSTFQVWMGLTVGCAKCHNHKYDPISQAEYYSLYAIFNQTADEDRPDEAPVLPAPSPEIAEKLKRIDAKVAELRKRLGITTPEIAASQASWEKRLAGKIEWVELSPTRAEAERGSTLKINPDRSITAEGPNPAKETYTVSAKTDLAGITAFRLEALPIEGKGVSGRAPDGNFVLSRFSVRAAPEGEPANQRVGRYVRVELPGKGQMLSLAEVQVFRGAENLAKSGKAEQSSTDYDGAAARAIDGNTDGDYHKANSVSHTAASTDPWWEVKLAENSAIDRVSIWNRTDGGFGIRLSKFNVKILDETRKVVWETQVVEAPEPSRELAPADERAIALEKASADFSQDGFAIADVIKSMSVDSKGWAVSPKQNAPREAIFPAKTALKAIEKNPSGVLTFRLEHRYKSDGYNLGRFRLSAAKDDRPTKRAALPSKILAIIDKAADQRSKDEISSLADYYRSIAPELNSTRDEIASLEKSRPTVPTLPVMVELGKDKRRATTILIKANHLAPGEKVDPALPKAFHSLPKDAVPDRLSLARWLVAENNPLSARVAVNRYWAQLFGAGLVETEEDFGTQGELPSHPELLDQLALEYINSGWDTKALLRMIVTSATYRQSSKVTPELLAKDPRNAFYSRGPRFRLEAEMIRDQALALGGLLSRKVGGPSVFPPQPDGLWQAAFNGQRTWSTSTGEDRYRRGLYTFWRRTVPYPAMAALDAPSRETCSLRRVRTNTPLQAFVTLNDPVFVEAAQALGRRIMREGGATVESRVRRGLLISLGRPASQSQAEQLINLYQTELDHYRKNPGEAKSLATEPLGPLPPGVDVAEAAAWTAVGNVLLNLDGVLTKG